MRALRVENDEARARAGAPDDQPYHPSRERLRALAHEFPGALAEIDRVPLALLESRLAELDALLACERESRLAPAWARAWIDAHRTLRGALAIKAWLAGQRTVDDTLRERLDHALDTMRFAEDARPLADRLAEIASPPRGRLVDWVFDEVAARHGLDRTQLRALLMPRT